ncbi:MAG: fibronectin type III domain-containing protein, partial [Bacteroidaceae bacterium]|nr:fibronectin type III domain-containing protein [Bacteroidaceae bacterium]
LPAERGLAVPFEVSLAVHSDAGVRRDNGIYGTLGICTTDAGSGQTTLPSGLSREASQDLANLLLNSVTDDLRRTLPQGWTRREMWDKNYGESRTPAVPSSILETLSHQNFGDLVYGHDPWFKFLLARGIYKGLLRFVNYEHGVRDFVVQPLPPRALSAVVTADGSAVLVSWQPTPDSLERTATPTGYILYTARGDGGFDNGQLVTGQTNATVRLQPGELLRFRVAARNAGGLSLPSEEMAVSAPQGAQRRVLVVNAFDRVSGPAQVRGDGKLGFDLDADFGVAWGYNASYCGRQKNFSTALEWTEGPSALGYSGSELQGKIFAGNTFDFTTEHARAIAAQGTAAVSSCSREAFESGAIDLRAYDAIDVIGGLERDAPQNLRPHKLFTPPMRQRLTECARRGQALFVSGAYLGSELTTDEERAFAADVLHYTHADTLDAGNAETLAGLGKQITIHRTPCEVHYAAQHPEVIMPADAATFSAFAYANQHGAGTAYGGPGARVVCTAFPFECIKDPAMQRTVMGAILRFLLPKKQ